jgi:hypothetical protein
MIRAFAIIATLASVAHADDPPSRAEEQASEANLQSIAPRAGVTFSASAGGGLILGDGVGRGPAVSFRLGHVATLRDVLLLDISISTLLHEPMPSDLRTNILSSITAGGLHYTSGSLWVRGGAGLLLYTVDDVGKSKSPHLGGGGTVGIGVDLARWRYLVLGLEAFGTGGIVATKGLMVTSGICLGLTYY